jgi:hypothetical protein
LALKDLISILNIFCLKIDSTLFAILSKYNYYDCS